MTITTEEATAISKGIVVALCGSRWVSPPVRMIDEYPVPGSGRVLLSGRPVVTVHTVKVDGVLKSDYKVVNGYVLDVGRYDASCGSRTVEIEYTYGQVALPGVVQRAVEVFADEIMAAENNLSSCRIPERVTNITRQGVSWTLLDPQDFLEKGRTGIYEVDLAILAANPAGARRRARVFTTTVSAPAIRRLP